MNLLPFIVTTAIWGSTWIAITFQVDQAPALASVFHRFAMAAAGLALTLLGNAVMFMPARRPAAAG